ncbi:MAG: type II toxin-antitoxin system VapC family toxin [Gemmatimonadota bacterium]
MGGGLILETTFLVDLERELARGHAGPTQAWLEARDEALFLPFIVAGEIAAGTPVDQRPRWEEFIGPFQFLPCTEEVCWEYGQLYHYLQRNGLLIGANDLWIAATALANGKPLVTRNVRDFERVPNLRLITWQD